MPRRGRSKIRKTDANVRESDGEKKIETVLPPSIHREDLYHPECRMVSTAVRHPMEWTTTVEEAVGVFIHHIITTRPHQTIFMASDHRPMCFPGTRTTALQWDLPSFLLPLMDHHLIMMTCTMEIVAILMTVRFLVGDKIVEVRVVGKVERRKMITVHPRDGETRRPNLLSTLIVFLLLFQLLQRSILCKTVTTTTTRMNSAIAVEDLAVVEEDAPEVEV